LNPHCRAHLCLCFLLKVFPHGPNFTAQPNCLCQTFFLPLLLRKPPPGVRPPCCSISPPCPGSAFSTCLISAKKPPGALARVLYGRLAKSFFYRRILGPKKSPSLASFSPLPLKSVFGLFPFQKNTLVLFDSLVKPFTILRSPNSLN